MHAHKAVRFGMYLAILLTVVSSAAAQPADKDRIDQALSLAEARAAQPAAESRSMYPANIPSRPSINLVQATTDNKPVDGLSQMDALAEASPATTAVPPAEVAQAAAAPAAEDDQAMPVFSIKQDLKNTPRWLWEDTKRVYTSPLALGLLMTAGGASIALHQHVDWTINNKFQESRTCKEAWGDTANVVGHPVLHLGIAGAWYMAGYEFKDLKTYNVGKNMLSALIITDLSTLALKGACAGTEGPSGQNFSFPSGHASSTFALASVLHEAYGPVVGVPMYGVAGWVAFERLDDRKHMFSDVIFGGMMGLVIGHSVASGHLPQIAGGNIIPYADPVEGTAGIAWWKTTK